MTQEELQEYHEYAFDAFCKRVIKNAQADAYRERRKSNRMEMSVDDQMAAYINASQSIDNYILYSRTFWVKDMPIHVKDKRLAEALQYIIPSKRSVLLLSYFAGYNDTEVAQALGTSVTSVARRKHSGLMRLRELMEARNNE